MENKKPVQVNVSVNAIIEKGGKFLLLQQARPEKVQGKWGFPGGKVDEGETFEMALLREVKEETGLIVERLKYIGCKHEYPLETIKHFFFVKTLQNAVKLSLDEILAFQWCTPQEIQDMNKENILRKPWVYRALEEWQQTHNITSKLRGDMEKN